MSLHRLLLSQAPLAVQIVVYSLRIPEVLQWPRFLGACAG
jgi:hypothetical protein